MRVSISTLIAYRFIRSRTQNGYLSFIAYISMIGLVLGVSALIVVTSVMNGFEQVLNTKILGMVPHVSLINPQGYENWENTARNIESNDVNITGVAPFINARGISSIKGEFHGTIINGIDIDHQNQVSILPEVIKEGSLDSLQPGKYNIVLGKYLVNERKLKIGDPVHIMIVRASQSASGIEPEFYTFTLSGVFEVSEKVDSWLSYINIEDAKSITGTDSKATGIRLQIKDTLKAKASENKAKDFIRTHSDEKIYTTTWMDTHYSLYNSIVEQKRMLSLFLFLIVLVAVFNVISALIMMTTEKNSEIAILKTIGASKSTILRIFIGQGVFIGLIGTLSGLVIGLLITLTIEDISRWLNSALNLDLFDNYYVTALPAKIDISEIFMIVIVSLVLCILASIYPALKASNKTPVEGLRQDY